MSIVQSNLFNPTSIPGCSLWLDAADRTTLTLSGSNVSQWNDKSSNAKNLAQGTSGNRPSYVLINDRPFLNFTASSTTFLSNTSMNIDYRTSCVYLVFQRKSIQGNNGVFCPLANANSGTDWENTNEFIITTATEVASAGSGTIDSQSTNLNLTTYAFQFNNNSLTTFRDFGTTSVLTRNMGLTTSPTALYIGRRRDGGNLGPSDMYFGESIVYNRALTTSEYQQLEGYLAWKWGLQANLPAGHPYKTVPAYSAQPFPLVRGPTTITPTANFNPSSIASCQLWLDAADTSTLTMSGQLVSQWNDKSGNGFTATASGADRPTYNSATRYLLFNGTSSQFAVSNGAYPSGNSPYSIFIVGYTNNAADPQWILAGGTESINQAIGVLFYTTNAVWHSWWANEYRVDNSITNGVPSILNLSYTTLRTTIVNGGTPTTNNPGTTRNNPSTNNFIGRRIGNSQFLNGGLGEILIFSSELTDNQRQQVEGYLATKWNLQSSLPGTQPYKTLPFYTSQPFPLLQPPRTLTPTVFSPTSVPSCQVWLDATDTASITFSGSAVSTWGDKTGNGHIATATGTITRSAVINGRQAMVWGANAFSTYFRGAVDNLTPRVTAFAVFSMNSSSYTSARVVSLGVVNTPDFNNVAYTAAIERNVSVFNAFRNAANLSGATATFGVPVVVCSEFTGAKHTFYLNGIESTPVASTGNFNYNIYQIGGSLGEENLVNYDGSIGEVLLYPSLLTRNERQSVEGYLAWKWGLQSSLPAGHPFKAFPPI